MKSQHRHELETNALAQHLAVYIDRLRPYAPTIFGAIIAVVVLLFGVSYFSSATMSRQSEAWNTYNQAVGGYMPNLPLLREAAGEYPDSPMQQWADITWADGQVWVATRNYVQNRAAAMDALTPAEGTYKSLLGEAEDSRLASRAHYGLGRIYEMRNELDKARAEYLQVEGNFKPLAEHRAEQLEEAKIKSTYDWLASAEAPRPMSPVGPGTPGERPQFSEGDLDLPAAGGQGAAGSASPLDDLFQGLGTPKLPGANEDRYGPESGESEGADAEAAADPLAPQQPAGEAAPEP